MNHSGYGLFTGDVVASRPTYYMIYREIRDNLAEFVCIVDRQEVAADFCSNHPGYFYRAS